MIFRRGYRKGAKVAKGRKVSRWEVVDDSFGDLVEERGRAWGMLIEE